MEEEKIQTATKPVKPKSKLKWNITAGGAVLALVTFCCGSIASGLIFSGGGDSSPESAPETTRIAVTQVVVTQISSGPTSPPEVIFVTPTMPADWTQVQSFNGQSKFTTELFSLDTGKVKIKWHFVGPLNFAFTLKGLDNDFVELLENKIGNSDGQKIMNVGASDQYVIDVLHGDGVWEITIEFMP